MRRALGTVLVVVLVVLAGCSGVFGGGDGSTETVTPAAVPTDEATATPAPRLVPGVTKRGIESPRALVAAHQSFLQNRSFTQRSNSTALAANGSAVLRTTGTLRAGPMGTFRYVSNSSGPYLAKQPASLPMPPRGRRGMLAGSPLCAPVPGSPLVPRIAPRVGPRRALVSPLW